jgi:fatty-acyl-CoA synthase
LVDHVDRNALANGKAERAEEGASRKATFVSVGKALHEVELEISDEQGRLLPDRMIGEIVIKSTSMMEGYLNDPEATAKVFRDGWLRTGDLGYLVDGELFITGRLKDIIIIAGQNHHAEDIERVVLRVAGLRPGSCICIQTSDRDKLVVLAEAQDMPDDELSRCRDEIARLLTFEMGLTAHDIVLLPARSLPKTSSGKLQRQLARKMYEEGRFPPPLSH